MLSSLDVLGGVPDEKLSLILAGMQVLLVGAFMFCNKGGVLSPEQEALVADIPSDPRTARAKFGIEPDFIPYACCSKCFALYLPQYHSHDYDKVPSYPARCSFRDSVDKEPCNIPLLVPRDKRRDTDVDDENPTPTTHKPARIFGYQTFKTWLARLFSRPDLETFMDEAWARAQPGTDIWAAHILQNFKGPDGNPFSQRPDGHSHLIFSLFVDWFNPYGNKQAGKSYSTGAMYMICLNLPMHLRYQLENVYLVGIIPGPREPSLHQINHLLRPLVNELIQFWKTGFFISRTCTFGLGRLVRGALIPLVCDLPAARKTAGFMGHGATMFCSFCRLRLNDIQNVNSDTWPKRHSWKEHMLHACRWRDAGTKSLRETIEKTQGVRYSELLRLPYWDPTRFTVLDTMHNLFLGEFQHHCRNVWQMNIKGNKKKKIEPHTPAKQRKELNRGVRAIVKGSRSTLLNLRKGYLVSLAQENGVALSSEGTRRRIDYIEALIGWVRWKSFV